MMKAGTYYVGDLCYVLHDEWDEVCSLIIEGNRCIDGEFNLKDGTRFAIYGTAYGDGNYFDQNGKSYDVDAGSIGCVLLDDIDLSNQENFLAGGNIHTFDTSFYTGTMDGKIMFHTLSIDTDPVYNEEEEYESF
jgi:hypothetical protein